MFLGNILYYYLRMCFGCCKIYKYDLSDILLDILFGYLKVSLFKWLKFY